MTVDITARCSRCGLPILVINEGKGSIVLRHGTAETRYLAGEVERIGEGDWRQGLNRIVAMARASCMEEGALKPLASKLSVWEVIVMRLRSWFR